MDYLGLGVTIGVAYLVADVVKTLIFATVATLKYRAAMKKRDAFLERLRAMEQQHGVSQETATEQAQEVEAG